MLLRNLLLSTTCYIIPFSILAYQNKCKNKTSSVSTEICKYHFYLQILINDNGTPPLSSITRVVVKVTDINDNAPEFEQVSYDVHIPPSSDENQSLFQVRICSLINGSSTIR